MPDFLDEKKQEIQARLKELKPLVDEYHTLERMLEVSGGVLTDTPQATSAKPPKRTRRRGSHGGSTRSRKAASRANGGTTGRRGRPKGSGTRGAEALTLVKASPGITIPELAAQMGIKQNYLYRVLPGLADDGLVEKDEATKGWHPKEQ